MRAALSSLPAEIDLSSTDIIAIVVAAGEPLAILLLWWLPPRYVRKIVNWLDSLVPMQLSDFTTAASWGIISFLSAIVIASVGLSIATSLGGDTANIWSVLEDFGKEVLTTAVPRMLRVLGIVIFAWLAIRVFQRAIPTLVRRFLPRQPESKVQEEEVEKRTRTLEGVFRATTNALVVTAAFLTVLTELDVNVAPL